MSGKFSHVLAAGAVALALLPATVMGQDNKTSPDNPAARPQPLPIHRVVLFTSGVGYFQRQGQVENDAHVDLAFPVQDVNDLLKSLVLRDLSGGLVRAVGYDSQDPVSKTLKNFAINLGDNPSFGQLLTQARGEKVEVTWLRGGAAQPAPVSGTILGVETQKQALSKDAVVDVEMLNLWSGEGLRSLKLSEVSQVRFLNPALDSEIKRALEVLAQGHDTQKKTVRLSFTGKGKRQVQVGYVVEHPVWRTSYRLVLGAKGKEPYLQGWAMVENPTGEDWNKVQVQLVSGRPISFRMDLYQPLYVERPLIELERFASLRPRTYEGALDEPPDKKKEDMQIEKRLRLEKILRAVPSNNPKSPADDATRSKLGGEALKESVQSAAHGEKLGEAFQYVIDQPVTLPRQKSAMLPIVSSDVKASRVSIYNEKVQATYPLLGLKLKNTTGLHLMQGPVTVFEVSSYAGDGLINDVQPNDERLLSYAIDLGMEVKDEVKTDPELLVKLKIVRGIMEKTVVLRESRTYLIRNRADADRLLIIEQPNRAPDYRLLTPTKPSAETRAAYRFAMTVPKGEKLSFPVVEERQVLEQVVLGSADDQTVKLLMLSPVGSPALQAALKKALDLKAKLETTRQEVSRLEGQLKEIAEDQGRQRENMKVIPQTDPVYRKYLEKFLSQETEIDRLRTELTRLRAVVTQQNEAYVAYVQNLTVKED